MSNQQPATSNQQPATSNQQPATSNQLSLLKKHFPNCFDKNGAFIPEKLQEIVQSIGVPLSSEGYSLNWLGKSYARLLANENIRTLLQADTQHNALAENKNSQNLLIKGDNLEVLKHLVSAYSEQIKMIYIDPPYNTGSDGFVYADDRKFTAPELSKLAGIDEEEAKRILEFTTSKSNSHSAWLTFMYPRLYMARQLLRDDGVIFISIDDNEQAQLKLLCDEVFGEDNFVVDFIWQHRKSSQNDVDVSLSHNHIFCYANTRSVFKLNSLKIDSEKFSNPDSDCRGDWIADPFDAPNRRENLTYLIINPNTGEKHLPPSGRHWRFSQDKFANALADNRIIFGKNGKGRPQYKRFKFEAEKKGTNPFSIWTEMGTATEGTKELMKIFDGHKIFDTPKPVRLIKEILKISCGKQDLIIDFFAGSGTTAHAVMELNKEDGGNRQFICVQIDDPTDPKSEAFKAGYKTIFDITKARIEKAGAKIKGASTPLTEELNTQNGELDLPPLLALGEEGAKQEGRELDLGFKIFETVPMFDKFQDEPEELTDSLEKIFDASTLSQKDRENLLLTWMVRDGVKLGTPIESLSLNGYTAYTTGKTLYFIEPDISLAPIISVLEQLDNNPDFAPNRLVIFGYLLESKAQREISEAVKHYNNRKGIELTLDVRYN